MERIDYVCRGVAADGGLAAISNIKGVTIINSDYWKTGPVLTTNCSQVILQQVCLFIFFFYSRLGENVIFIFFAKY